MNKHFVEFRSLSLTLSNPKPTFREKFNQLSNFITHVIKTEEKYFSTRAIDSGEREINLDANRRNFFFVPINFKYYFDIAMDMSLGMFCNRLKEI